MRFREAMQLVQDHTAQKWQKDLNWGLSKTLPLFTLAHNFSRCVLGVTGTEPGNQSARPGSVRSPSSVPPLSRSGRSRGRQSVYKALKAAPQFGVNRLWDGAGASAPPQLSGCHHGRTTTYSPVSVSPSPWLTYFSVKNEAILRDYIEPTAWKHFREQQPPNSKHTSFQAPHNSLAS